VSPAAPEAVERAADFVRRFELALGGSAAGSPIALTAVERIAIGEDGLATERISYFDSLPLILTVARPPRVWPGFLRSRFRGGSR
jgi:hypothetical protein